MPAPRGTTGTRCARRPAQHRLHVLGAGGPDHRERPAGVRVAGPVLAVGRDDVAVGEHRHSAGSAAISVDSASAAMASD